MTALAPTAPAADRQELRRTDTASVNRESSTATVSARHGLRHRAAPAPVRRTPAPPGREPAADPGDPTALCCAVAHAATEVLRGVRPLAQLVRSVSPEVYDQLEALARVRSAARDRRGAPPTPQSRSRVRRARVVRVAPDAAEATVIIDDVDRVRAAALRVELHRGRWRVVVLEIG
jgi:hypothetical protein